MELRKALPHSATLLQKNHAFRRVNVKTLRILACLALYLALITATANAAGGAHPWSDSLDAQALFSGPSLQEVLDGLGYTINVASDEVPLQLFAPPSGGTNGEVTLKFKNTASNSPLGWYVDGNSSATTQLFTGIEAVGTKANIAVAAGTSIGLYLGPTLYDDVWYTQTVLNWDAYRHIRVFNAGAPNKYVVAWEDLPDGGDQDFQDCIVEVYFRDPNQLSLTFEGNTNISVCNPDSICFLIHTDGGVGNLTLSQIVNGSPQVLTSGPAPYTYRFCFLPTSYAITDYRFIFRINDQSTNQVQDTFDIHLSFQYLPIISLSSDFLDTLICKRDTICFDVLSATDPDNDPIIYSLIDGPGVMDSTTGRICFLPNNVDSADYRFIVMASDPCCYSYPVPRTELPCPRDTVIYRVILHRPPVIVSIPDTAMKVCKLDPICFPAYATKWNGTHTAVAQECGPGSISNEQLCFTPTGAGLYTFCLKATDECGGIVRDTVRITISVNAPPTANAGRDSSVSQCAAAQICWPASCSDPDGNLQSCTLFSGPGSYNGSQICFTPTGSGTYTFVLKATDLCGDFDLDTAVITVQMKNPPVALVRDTTVKQCNPTQICLPASCSDPDNDLSTCQLISGPGVYNGTAICFTPTASGTYQFILKATDACGATDLDTGVAVVTLNRRPDVVAGGGNYSFCRPESLCVPITASDPDGDVLTFTSTMGKIVGNTICLWSGGEGRRQLAYNVIATDPCGAKDTALYTVNVVVNMVPVIQVPTLTPLTLCRPTEQCFTVTAIDTIMGKLSYSILSGPGMINASTGRVCFTPPSAATYNWQIVVTDSCGKADTGSVSWQVGFYPTPSAVVVPPSGDTVVCWGDTIGSICKPVTYSNPEQSTTITVVPSDPGISWSFGYSAGTGQLCFEPRVDVNRVYDFTFYRVNQCNDTAKSIYSYEVKYDRCDSACMIISLEETPCFNIGSLATARIFLSDGKVAIGGFDLLIEYDPSAFTFVSAALGSAITGWEYFTYRLGPFGNCGSGCPTGLVRVVALADANNGAAHPPAGQLRPDGAIVNLTFRITQDAQFEGLVFPLKFYWFDCGDNGVSSVTGDTLLVDKSVYGPEEVIWDEFDEIGYPETGRLDGVGVPDTCLAGDKKVPIRCVEFHNGFICIIDKDSIDARGDLNLNGFANEIADAVLYTNYFLRGISVFKLSVAAQTAASDVNNDGRTLTVGDLVYLLRVLVGDALPIPKLSPNAEQVDFTVKETGGSTTLMVESGTQIGGIYLQVRSNGGITDIGADPAFADMKVQTYSEGDLTSIVVYSENKGAVIPAGLATLLTIPGSCEVVHFEASDYHGNMLVSHVTKTSLPSSISLGQNYPNPFNPTTTISFSLPTSSDWTLSVINVNGQVVKRYSGAAGYGNVSVSWDATDQSGQPVATGVYFYRLDAGNFTDTKKMVLMK
jgi:hypothetical protein